MLPCAPLAEKSAESAEGIAVVELHHSVHYPVMFNNVALPSAMVI
jgi:hypothetical protein